MLTSGEALGGGEPVGRGEEVQEGADAASISGRRHGGVGRRRSRLRHVVHHHHLRCTPSLCCPWCPAQEDCMLRCQFLGLQIRELVSPHAPQALILRPRVESALFVECLIPFQIPPLQWILLHQVPRLPFVLSVCECNKRPFTLQNPSLTDLRVSRKNLD